MSQVQAEYESAVAAITDLKRLIALQESALSYCWGAIPDRSRAGKLARSGHPGRSREPSGRITDPATRHSRG